MIAGWRPTRPQAPFRFINKVAQVPFSGFTKQSHTTLVEFLVQSSCVTKQKGLAA
jgi:hypothetical protein